MCSPGSYVDRLLPLSTYKTVIVTHHFIQDWLIMQYNYRCSMSISTRNCCMLPDSSQLLWCPWVLPLHCAKQSWLHPCDLRKYNFYTLDSLRSLNTDGRQTRCRPLPSSCGRDTGTGRQQVARRAPCPYEPWAPWPGVWHTPARRTIMSQRESWQAGEVCNFTHTRIDLT